MAQPGILWVNSKITRPDSITPENFNKWYSDIHIPDILATSGFDSAVLYKSIDPKADRPYLAIYPVSDVNWLGSQEFSSIPNTSNYFPGPSHKCFDYADFDSRFYEFIHSYEKPGTRAGATKLVISAGLTPAAGTDADFDAWYREEHYSTLAACPGYVRTRRYKLKTAVKAENPTTYLSLHEFECDVLPQADLDKTAETPWSKKTMASLLGAEIDVFALSGAWGEATCLAQISGYLGWVLPANTLTLINESLGGSPNITWVALAWTLGFTVGLALVGRLSDIFGRRWFFIGSSLMALVGNIIGASAQSVNQLIGTNCLNGLAAAGQLSFNVTIGELVPNKLRGPFNALVLSTSIPFAVFGPPIARAFYEHTALQWRWSYILGCIINTIAAVTYYFCYYPPSYLQLHVNGRSMMKQLKGLDWIGIFLFSAGLVLFLIGLNWGGQTYPWNSAYVLSTLIIGIGTLIAFGFYEACSGHEYPLIPMRLFKNIKYDAIVACASVAAMIYYSMTVVWPTLVGVLFTTSVQDIGWLSCAVGGGLLFGQIAAGLGIRYIPRMKLQMTVAAVIMVTFVGALASVDEYSRTRAVVFLLIGTAAAGYIENLTLSSMALVFEPEDIGLVAGALGSIRTACSAVATSLYLSVLSNQVTKYLPRYVTPAATEAGLPTSSLADLFAGITAGSFSKVEGITPAIEEAVGHAVKRAYSMSFRTVFLCTLPFGAIVLVAAILSPNVEDYLTDDVARRLQGKSVAPSGQVISEKDISALD